MNKSLVLSWLCGGIVNSSFQSFSGDQVCTHCSIVGLSRSSRELHLKKSQFINLENVRIRWQTGFENEK